MSRPLIEIDDVVLRVAEIAARIMAAREGAGDKFEPGDKSAEACVAEAELIIRAADNRLTAIAKRLEDQREKERASESADYRPSQREKRSHVSRGQRE